MTTKEQTAEVAVRARWTTLGLAENIQDDLILLAADLSNVAGVPVTSALDTIEGEVREVMKNRILNRVADTITYNGDLERVRGGREA
jgi:hypothetical protein